MAGQSSCGTHQRAGGPLVQVHRGENNGYFGMIEAEDDSPSIE